MSDIKRKTENICWKCKKKFTNLRADADWELTFYFKEDKEWMRVVVLADTKEDAFKMLRRIIRKGDDGEVTNMNLCSRY